MYDKINKDGLNYLFISTGRLPGIAIIQSLLINGQNNNIQLKLPKKIPLLFILSLTLSFSIGQRTKNESTEENYKAVNWNVDNGLSQDEVYSMMKDINGFLWIGA